jgi:hypothetical protein
MGFIDSIAKKIFSKNDYEDYSLTVAMDGCEGESKLEKLKELFKRPC